MAVIHGTWYVGSATTLGGGTDPDRRLVLSAMQDGKTYIVAKVFADDEGDFASTARLLAAAPDLLAALKLLRDPDGDGQWPCYCDDPHFDGGMCETCVASEAIAKAEGRE